MRSTLKNFQNLIKDSHRSGLYFHKLNNNDYYAVSLLEKLPLHYKSNLVCGYTTTPNSLSLYKNLNQNKDFIHLLQNVVKLNFMYDQHVIQDAFFRGQGWIPVMDERSPQTLGRAGDPDDYLGMVLVEGGGKINPNTYEVTPTYRLATRDNGFMKLSPTLDKALRLRLQEEAKSM